MLQIKFKACIYASDQWSEAWLTNIKTRKSRLVEVKHPGYQYEGAIREAMRERGFEFSFR